MKDSDFDYIKPSVFDSDNDAAYDYINKLDSMQRCYAMCEYWEQFYGKDYPEIYELFPTNYTNLKEIKEWYQKNPHYELYTTDQLFEAYKFVAMRKPNDYYNFSEWVYHKSNRDIHILGSFGNEENTRILKEWCSDRDFDRHKAAVDHRKKLRDEARLKKKLEKSKLNNDKVQC